MTHTDEEKRFQFEHENLRLVVMDVYGVLTNVKLHYSNNNQVNRGFDVKDRMSMKLLQSAILVIAWISGSHSGVTEQSQ